MDFVRKEIVQYETVITKELLDSFQDGIIEAITKAETALAIEPVVCNASSRSDFPVIGKVGVIYKDESEKILYQWNTTTLEYEQLYQDSMCNCPDDTFIDGGSASGDEEEIQYLDGGSAAGK